MQSMRYVQIPKRSEHLADGLCMKLSANNRRRKDLFTLPPADQAVLEDIGWKGKLIDIDNAILANARFLSQMVTNPEIFMGGPPGHDEEEIEQGRDSNDLQSQQHQGISRYCLATIIARSSWMCVKVNLTPLQLPARTPLHTHTIMVIAMLHHRARTATMFLRKYQPLGDNEIAIVLRRQTWTNYEAR